VNDANPGLDSLRRALGSIDLEDVDAVILLSPHGRSAGVYRTPRGDLSGFGIGDVAAERATDPGLVESLAAAWGAPVLEGPADYGVVVPLLLVSLPAVPLVACALPEGCPPAGDVQSSLGRALETVSSSRRLGLVVSAHASAGLSARAPLTELPGARAAEDRLVGALADDAGSLVELGPEIARAGGSCSGATLEVFGGVFSGRKVHVRSHEYPFGVGYVVAEVDRR
jgi:hypothetical protein